jgi:hypothetical protein
VTRRWPGGRLELSPSAARVLRVELGGVPAFWAPAAADGWNLGGDRLWFGPEWDWFWSAPPGEGVGGHAVPPSVDPGEWRASGPGSTGCARNWRCGPGRWASR